MATLVANGRKWSQNLLFEKISTIFQRLVSVIAASVRRQQILT